MDKTTWQDPVDLALARQLALLDQPVAAEDRYAVVDRYAAADRYTRAARYAAATPDRYAAAAPDRYAAASTPTRTVRGRRRGRGTKHHTRIYLIDLPPPRPHPGEQLLWMQSCEYEQAFEDWDPEEIWVPGSLVDFDYAIKSLREQSGDYEGEETIELSTIAVDCEQDTFQADSWCEWEDDVPIELGLRVRRELVGDPQRVMDALDLECLVAIGVIAGRRGGVPNQEEVLAAIMADPDSGLGAAAVDHMLWQEPERLGNAGQILAEALEQSNNSGYVRLTPVENFLLYTGSLQPGAAPRSRQSPGRDLYLMTGKYVITEITYHSDLTGTVVGGWRSCWLEAVKS